MKYINLNGKIIPENEGNVSATSRAVSYGDGCFETIRSYGGRFLNFEDHFERLEAGLEYLEMKSGLTEEKLRKEIQKLLDKNNLGKKDTVVRIQCFRKGGSGYFELSDQSGFVISDREVLNRKSELKLKTVSVRAIPSVALERKVKLSNGINYIKAAQEARKENYDDALMLTTNEFVSETTIANLFWIKNKVSTPRPLNVILLPGVTRSILMRLINEHSEYKLKEGEFCVEAIYNAEAVFCCNSVMEINSVSEVDGNIFSSAHPVIEELRVLFEEYKSENLK